MEKGSWIRVAIQTEYWSRDRGELSCDKRDLLSNEVFGFLSGKTSDVGPETKKLDHSLPGFVISGKQVEEFRDQQP
jgi:hypothetical protein